MCFKRKYPRTEQNRTEKGHAPSPSVTTLGCLPSTLDIGTGLHRAYKCREPSPLRAFRLVAVAWKGAGGAHYHAMSSILYQSPPAGLVRELALANL